MKSRHLASPLFAVALVLSTSTMALSHAGHGDEFEATGGVNRVEVKSSTDQSLGIKVEPIKAGAKILIPATAVVDTDGKQWVFVKFKNFYEPVEVTTGATQGELIEVTKNLSAGEQVVTQGGLMLYAQSKKTKPTASESASSAPASAIAQPKTDAAHAKAHAEGKAHSHESVGGTSKKGIIAAVGGVMALVAAGTGIVLFGRRKQTSEPAQPSETLTR